MTQKVKSKPDNYHSITPYLIMQDAAKAIDFYKNVFDATELFQMPAGEGKIGHAEIKIGDSIFMMADEYPNMGFKGPKSYGGSPISLMLYVEDVDSVGDRFVKAGGKVIRPIKDQFYGDRSGVFEDPFGHIWNLSTHIEDVPPDEMAKRAAAAHKEGASC